jgi:hypothetical protein
MSKNINAKQEEVFEKLYFLTKQKGIERLSDLWFYQHNQVAFSVSNISKILMISPLINLNLGETIQTDNNFVIILDPKISQKTLDEVIFEHLSFLEEHMPEITQANKKKRRFLLF